MEQPSRELEGGAFKRSCFTVDGRPKRAYATVDDAMAVVFAGAANQHAYRCPEHGWHLGRNDSRTARGGASSTKRDRERQACPACFGGRQVVGGNWGPHPTGTCMRCYGSGLECDDDYAYRIANLPKDSRIA